ncbi:protein TIS11 [Onthophagus taurus]|uniref:protein TIS11 n=1 Tax=Onthophagus taurus TaxID=166361 RepID=UPI000C2013C8|nr:protein TIS11 [Onthophagus taurus]
MSTAVMSQSAMYEFGDIIKNSQSELSSGVPLAVGAPAARYKLTRMPSTPVGSSSTAANLVSLITMTTNIQVQQQQQQQHRRLERTQSAPAPSAAVAATTVNTSRYKTELCRPYEEFGVCKYGDKCQFAHGVAELRSLARHPKYKTELCRTYHTVGFCPYGPRCHFVHNQDEVLQQHGRVQHHQQQQQHQVSAALIGGRPVTRPRPVALSPSLSLDSPSPPCSLSQSPTSSMGSFFSSEPELHSPGIEEQRLPVFNRLAAPLLALGDLRL